MASSLWQALLLGVVLVMSYCFNGSKYLLKSSSNELASFWFPQNETRTYEHRKQNVVQDNNLFAFMMRDANQMVAIDPPFGMCTFSITSMCMVSPFLQVAIRCSSTSMGARLEVLRVKNTR